MSKPVVPPNAEEVSSKVHEQWMESKRAQGVESRKSESGEELMVPYEQLSEAAKDLDRGSVKAVLSAIATMTDRVVTSPTKPEPPAKLYLQWLGADKDELTAEELLEPAEFADMTWCQHKIYDTDIEYVLAEVVVPSVSTAPDCHNAGNLITCAGKQITAKMTNGKAEGVSTDVPAAPQITDDIDNRSVFEQTYPRMEVLVKESADEIHENFGLSFQFGNGLWDIDSLRAHLRGLILAVLSAPASLPLVSTDVGAQDKLGPQKWMHAAAQEILDGLNNESIDLEDHEELFNIMSEHYASRGAQDIEGRTMADQLDSWADICGFCKAARAHPVHTNKSWLGPVVFHKFNEYPNPAQDDADTRKALDLKGLAEHFVDDVFPLAPVAAAERTAMVNMFETSLRKFVALPAAPRKALDGPEEK